MKTRIVVTAIIKKEDKYLFGRKPKDVHPYPNTWNLLGGGMHLGEEDLEKALRREIREEAGIEITNIKKVTFNEDTSTNKLHEETAYIFLIFVVQYLSGELKAGDDIMELQWFTKEELKNIALNEPTKKLFKEIGFFNS